MAFAGLIPEGKQELEKLIGSYACNILIQQGIAQGSALKLGSSHDKSKRKNARSQDAWYGGPGSGSACKASPAALPSLTPLPCLCIRAGGLSSSLLGQKMGDNWDDDWILHTRNSSLRDSATGKKCLVLPAACPRCDAVSD